MIQQDVAWLEQVTTPPVEPVRDEIVVALGRIEPIMKTQSGAEISTLKDWETHRNHLRSSWQDFLGPMPEERPDVVIDIVKTEEVGNVVRQLVRYEGEPGLMVEGYLLLPDIATSEAGEAGKRKWPAILALHQTTNASIDEIAGVSGSDSMQLGFKLCQQGYIVFCPRCFLWQNTNGLKEAVEAHKERHPMTTGMAKMLYDAVRGLDVLVSLPQVDGDRIGAIGHSLGAKEVLYVAAFDERVKVAVASEGGIGFRSTNWDAPWYLGEEIQKPEFPLNHHQLLAMIAPRPFLILGGESGSGAADGDRTWPLIEAALPAWNLYDQPVRLGLLNHHEGHSVSSESFERMSEWLTTYLESEE